MNTTGTAGDDAHVLDAGDSNYGSGSVVHRASAEALEDRSPRSGKRRLIDEHPYRPPGGEPGDPVRGADEGNVLRRADVHPCDVRGSPRALQQRERIPPPAALPWPAPPGPRGAHLGHQGGPLCQDDGDHGAGIESIVFTAGAERRAEGNARPSAQARRRITGKRKMVQGGDTLPPAQLGGSASRLRCDADIVHASSTIRFGDDHEGSLFQGVVGPDMPQATLIGSYARSSTSRGCGGSQARSASDAHCGTGDLQTFHVADGELNTLKSTSSPTASLQAGLPSSHAREAVAACHAQQSGS